MVLLILLVLTFRRFYFDVTRFLDFDARRTFLFFVLLRRTGPCCFFFAAPFTQEKKLVVDMSVEDPLKPRKDKADDTLLSKGTEVKNEKLLRLFGCAAIVVTNLFTPDAFSKRRLF